MGRDADNRNKDCKFNGPYAGRDMNIINIKIYWSVYVLLIFLCSVFSVLTNNRSESGEKDVSDTFDPESTAEEHVGMPNWEDNDGGWSNSPISQAEEHLIMSGWGDSNEGRPSYSDSQVEYNYPGNQIVFNSISREHGSGDFRAAYPGDEKDFVRICRSDADPDDDSSWKSEHIYVKGKKPYMIKLYINNNNCYEYNVAKDTKVALSIPSYSDTQIPVRGYIKSSNAIPSKYWDSVTFNSKAGRPFHLEFKTNTAMLHNNSIGANGLQLSNDIVSKAAEGGTLIGYDKLDGEIPGGSQYKCEVTAWINVIYDEYGVKQKVRKLGDKTWKESINAEIGDQVEFQIEYNNASNKTQTNVMIRDVLPGNLEYVPDTTKIYNCNYPNWAILKPDGDIVTRGVNIGSYLGNDDVRNGGNAFIRFTAKVVDTNLTYGKNFIYNWGQATVGNSLIENPSTVIVQKSE